MLLPDEMRERKLVKLDGELGYEMPTRACVSETLKKLIVDCRNSLCSRHVQYS